MDVITTAATTVSDLDSQQPVIETPTRIQPAKPISFSNGKRCLDHQHHVFMCLKWLLLKRYINLETMTNIASAKSN